MNHQGADESGRHRPMLVDGRRLERSLARLADECPNPDAGLFGPGSETWRVNREAILFLGAGRAALLQTAHPWVAAAIAEHSTTMVRPISRFHRTFTIMFSMVFGNIDQAFAMARRLHRLHDTVSGTMKASAGPFPAGSPYTPNEVNALKWVYATLIDTSVLIFELGCAPLAADERNAFYRESWRLAGLFGLEPGDLPPDWTAFQSYMEDMLSSGSITVTSDALRIGNFLMTGRATSGKRTAPPPPVWYRALTARFLPESLRGGYGLAFGPSQAKSAERALGRIKTVHRRLPARLRYVPPYHEALGRLAGRRGSDMLTRGLNRLWVGRPRLVS